MDLNADGFIDLLGASYGGTIYVFYGDSKKTFSESVILKDKIDTYITSGMYVDPDPKNPRFNVEGDVREMKNPDYAHFVKAHDWDNDGDLDLFLSGSQGVKLCINEGTANNPIFSENTKQIIKSHHADAIVDWDGDGLFDILGGTKKGGVYISKNIGSSGSPVFEKAKCLVYPKKLSDKPVNPKGGLTQLAVTDYNNDKKLDLIIGCNSVQRDLLNELNINNNLERFKLKRDLRDIENKLKVRGEEILPKLDSILKKSDKALIKDEKYIKLFAEKLKIEDLIQNTEPVIHGYVWVCLSK